MTVYWTNETLAKIAEIQGYLLATAPDQAEQIVESFFDRAQQLGSFPKMGRTYHKEEMPQVHEILNGNYRLTYYVGLNPLDIMTIKQQSQNR